MLSDMSTRGRKLFDKQPNLHFITTTITEYQRVFAAEKVPNERYCDLIIRVLEHQLTEHLANLIAFVIMPSHLHFIVYMPEGESISDFKRDFKKFTSNKIKRLLYLDKKYDIIRIIKAASCTGGHKVWKDRFDDYIITSEHMLEVKMNYIHDNPGRQD